MRFRSMLLPNIFLYNFWALEGYWLSFKSTALVSKQSRYSRNSFLNNFFLRYLKIKEVGAQRFSSGLHQFVFLLVWFLSPDMILTVHAMRFISLTFSSNLNVHVFELLPLYYLFTKWVKSSWKILTQQTIKANSPSVHTIEFARMLFLI